MNHDDDEKKAAVKAALPHMLGLMAGKFLHKHMRGVEEDMTREKYDFETALDFLKNGSRMRRVAWQSDTWIWLADDITANLPISKASVGQVIEPSIMMKEDEDFYFYVPQSDDLLAKDWIELDALDVDEV